MECGILVLVVVTGVCLDTRWKCETVYAMGTSYLPIQGPLPRSRRATPEPSYSLSCSEAAKNTVRVPSPHVCTLCPDSAQHDLEEREVDQFIALH